MSASNRVIKRYLIEYKKIENGRYPSLKDIENSLREADFKTSVRTIQRDFEKFRNEFGIEILYDKTRKGYYIDKETSINFKSFVRFLEILSTADLLKEGLKDVQNVLKYVSFDNTLVGLKGIDNLKLLFQAVKAHRIINFTHYNFKFEKYTNYTIKPYLLKEYNNRWYVIGIIGNNNYFTTFGIERIEKLEVTTKKFKPDNNLNPQEKFNRAIGVYLPKELKPELIVLSFTPYQGKYVKTLALHHSQKILIDNDKELRIRLFVVPNYEFKQMILSHLDTVKVIKPDYLAQEIKNLAGKIIKKYQ